MKRSLSRTSLMSFCHLRILSREIVKSHKSNACFFIKLFQYFAVSRAEQPSSDTVNLMEPSASHKLRKACSDAREHAYPTCPSDVSVTIAKCIAQSVTRHLLLSQIPAKVMATHSEHS